MMRSMLVSAALLSVACGNSDHVPNGGGEGACPPIVEDGGGGIDAPPKGAALCPIGACN